MKANALEILGLDELREALRKLPPELVHEGAAIVHAHAAETARQVEASYPVATGNLKTHVVVDVETSASYATARVRSTAYHAWMYEHGTGDRSYNGQDRGRMPAAHTFIPIAIRRRALMVSALIELVERAGLTVSGR